MIKYRIKEIIYNGIATYTIEYKKWLLWRKYKFIEGTLYRDHNYMIKKHKYFDYKQETIEALNRIKSLHIEVYRNNKIVETYNKINNKRLYVNISTLRHDSYCLNEMIEYDLSLENLKHKIDIRLQKPKVKYYY